jgi:F0F1-type ATP synthase assembly protein I
MSAHGGDSAGQGEARATESNPDEVARVRRTRMRATALALQFGTTIAFSLVIFLWGGIWLDRRLGTSPLFLLIGLVLAFMAIGYSLYELATVGTRRGGGAKAAAARSAPPGSTGPDERTRR